MKKAIAAALALVFVAKDSGNFNYIAVADGAKFLPAPTEGEAA